MLSIEIGFPCHLAPLNSVFQGKRFSIFYFHDMHAYNLPHTHRDVYILMICRAATIIYNAHDDIPANFSLG